MIAAASGSWFTTKKDVHESNDFNFGPIKEVAILFVGIFATMLPALDWLQSHSKQFAHLSPAVFFWGSGTLSSVLDNAPTYLTFLSTTGQVQMALALADPVQIKNLQAISIGCVFFGANTYIGNGPNFLVKAIADHQKARTPGFMAYILHFTLPFMLPMLVIIWLLFFRT